MDKEERNMKERIHNRECITMIVIVLMLCITGIIALSLYFN